MMSKECSETLVNLKDVGVGLSIIVDKVKCEGETATELRKLMLNILKEMNGFFQYSKKD